MKQCHNRIVIYSHYFFLLTRACLKKRSYNLHAPICDKNAKESKRVIRRMDKARKSSKESRYPIFVASEQRLDASGYANIQPAATNVTNIGYRLSLEASPLLCKSGFNNSYMVFPSISLLHTATLLLHQFHP